MRTINLEVKDIKFSMESTKNVQNMNLQLSNKILTKWTLHCPFIIIKSSLEFHSMFPAKHQKIVKGRAKKKPSKLCSTYSHHHRRLGESWRDRVFLSPLPCQCALLYSGAGLYVLESVQDFLIKLDMKPSVHLVEISIFSLNLIIVGLMNRANKNWAQF